MEPVVLQGLKIRKWLYFDHEVCYNNHMKTHQYFVLFILLLSSAGWAQSSGSRSSTKRTWLLSNKSEAEAAHRFSLAEWLDTKNRNNAMDMWLGSNTNADIYEFKLSLNMQQDDVTAQTGGGAVVTSGNFLRYEGEFSAYAKNVGLTAGYHNNTEENFNDTTGMFNFRLFGKSMQTSHLTLHYGLRTRLGSGPLNYRLNQQFPAATLQIYLVENFGVYSHYRKYLKVNEDVFGDTEGKELQYGVFIEYGRLRIFGNIFEENQNSVLNNVNTDINHKGSKIGIQLFW